MLHTSLDLPLEKFWDNEKALITRSTVVVFINSFTMPAPWDFFNVHKESGIGSEWGNYWYAI